MLIHNYLKAHLTPERIHEGEGVCPHAMVFRGDEIDAPVQFINYTILPPGASFGLHEHGRDNEFYVVLSGNGIYFENGKETPVEAGDIIMNAPEASHGIRNTGDVDMPLLVFEVAIQHQEEHT
ncbi:MAG: cupin domain-containing protein [Clostridia bacterium]|nr:cupin domain-containing protein [Clostridia bacterium]